MIELQLYRTYRQNYTKGELVTPFGNFFTIERPYLNNKPMVSSINEGRYKVTKSHFYSGKHKGKKAFRLHNVKGRSGILIHIGNYAKDVVGCIAPGMRFDDSMEMVLDSTIAFDVLWKYLPSTFYLTIKKKSVDYSDFSFFNDYRGLEKMTVGEETINISKKQRGERNKIAIVKNLPLYMGIAFLFFFISRKLK